MLCDHPPACPPSCDHCLAYDRHARSLCSRLPSAGSKWCSVHEELQAKLLKTYKRMTLAVDLFDETTLPTGLEQVADETNLSQLRQWSAAARNKWGLTNRVVVARAEHHHQFYTGGDWGHCLFVETLKGESDRLDRLMRLLDRRAYALTLANSQAEWILSAPSIGFICDEPAVETPPTPPATPPSSSLSLPSTSTLSKNQRKKAQRKARKNSTSTTTDDCCPDEDKVSRHLTTSDHLARLREYLIPPSDLPRSIKPANWHSLISNLFRFVILRVPSLAPLALDPGEGRVLGSVEEFLDFLEERTPMRCGDEIARLWAGLKFAKTSSSSEEEGFVGVGVLGDCIADVFRPADDRGLHVAILGGKVFKDTTTAPELPNEGWDFFYQFIGCSGCSLSITRTFTAWSRNRRLALLGAYPAWLTPGETSPEHVFRVASLVLCGSNATACGKKVKRVEQKTNAGARRGQAKKMVLVEEWERAWMYVKMPRDDPRTTTILQTLASSPSQFVVLARDGQTLETTHAPPQSTACKTPGCNCCTNSDLWLGHVRSGLNPVERKSASWTTSTFFPAETVLASFSKSSSPEKRFGFDYTDVQDVLLMDNRDYDASGDWGSFAELVARAVLEAMGSETLKDLLSRERHAAVKSGEVCTPGTKQHVCLRKGAEGISYAAFDEQLKARGLFRER